MPTYTYRCESCGVQFDRFQKFTDKPLTRCPECRTGRVKRIPQPSAIVFKGSGWYATDHRSASAGITKKPEGETSETSAKPEKATDAKPEKSQAKSDE
jgi:putative FmdB family regulatory protein